MTDSSSSGTDDPSGSEAAGPSEADEDLDALRERVERKYDFDDFGHEQMAEMSYEEWDVAFDSETWIVGEELLDRVEKDLENRIADGDVFAVTQRVQKPTEQRVIAYSDEGYAIVYPDGSVEGEGTVLRDVKPTVALCSMESYEVPDPPEDVSLPSPQDVPEGSGEFGNLMLQIIAVAQLLAGLGLLVAWPVFQLTVVAGGIGVVFVGIGLFLLTVVANARLSDRFRAEEFRNRLRTVGVETDEPPAFLPPEARPDRALAGDSDDDTRANDGDTRTNDGDTRTNDGDTRTSDTETGDAELDERT